MKLFSFKKKEETQEERLMRLLNDKIARTERTCEACHKVFGNTGMCDHCETLQNLYKATSATAKMLTNCI